MLDCQFENLNHIDFAEVKPRMRSYHMRIKQKQSDLEDYELSKAYFIQNKQSDRVALGKWRRAFIA